MVIKTKPKPPTIEKVNVVRESEGESEIAMWKRIGEESLNALKDMQYTNERKRRREHSKMKKDRKAKTREEDATLLMRHPITLKGSDITKL